MGKKEGVPTPRKPRRHLKGAVLAEFAIAFMPICAMFLCLCELANLEIDRLAVMHAAMVGVRACAVIKDPDPGYKHQVDGTEADVETAVDTAMKPFTDSVGKEITIQAPECKHQGDANGGLDVVSIDATFQCHIPLASKIVCFDGPKQFTITAQFPHQGAEYKLFKDE